MNTCRRFNVIGISLAYVLTIFFQLIWLMDPIRIGPSNIYWIEIVDYLIYLFILIPILWFVSGLFGFGILCIGNKPFKEKRVFLFLSLLLELTIILCSVISIFFFIEGLNQWIWYGASLIIAWCLVLIDIILEEIIIFRKGPWKCFATLLFSIMLIIVLFYPTSYEVTYPGLTIDMNKYAEVEGGYPNGEVMGVLVFVRPAFPIDWVYRELFSNYDIKNIENEDIAFEEQLQAIDWMKSQRFPNYDYIRKKQKELPVEELLQIKREMKLKANQTAKRVAFKKVGLDKGHTIHSPIEVNFNSYTVHEGGPSHGAMLAIALINQLTPDNITNGNIVAGTGTIKIDGSIGPVGGLKQKAFTVERAGADVFFVPEEQLQEASNGSEHLNIIPVKNISDILEWLGRNPKLN
jgi:PDZ domain-containing protein